MQQGLTRAQECCRLSPRPCPGLWSASFWDGCGLRRDRWDSGTFKESPALARSWAPSSSSAAGPLAGEAASPVLPVSSLPFPSQASPPTGILPQCQGPPPLPYLFMAHTCCLPRRICERRSSLVGNKSVMRECDELSLRFYFLPNFISLQRTSRESYVLSVSSIGTWGQSHELICRGPVRYWSLS